MCIKTKEESIKECDYCMINENWKWKIGCKGVFTERKS